MHALAAEPQPAAAEEYEPFGSGQDERGGGATSQRVRAEHRRVGHGRGRHLRGERAVAIDDPAQPPLGLRVGGAQPLTWIGLGLG